MYREMEMTYWLEKAETEQREPKLTDPKVTRESEA
jgi:hypothetical protein